MALAGIGKETRRMHVKSISLDGEQNTNKGICRGCGEWCDTRNNLDICGTPDCKKIIIGRALQLSTPKNSYAVRRGRDILINLERFLNDHAITIVERNLDEVNSNMCRCGKSYVFRNGLCNSCYLKDRSRNFRRQTRKKKRISAFNPIRGIDP